MTQSSEDLDALLVRVEAAIGPDRELDARLYVGLIVRLQNPAIDRMLVERAGLRPDANVWLDGARDWQVKHYTASLDAVLALCERLLGNDWRYAPKPLWTPAISQYFNGDWEARLYRADNGGRFVSVSKTPALALLAAMLKAIIASASTEKEG